MNYKVIQIALSLILICISSQSFAKKEFLKNEDWLSSLEKRALLKFITQCALGKDQVLAIETDGLVFEY